MALTSADGGGIAGHGASESSTLRITDSTICDTFVNGCFDHWERMDYRICATSVVPIDGGWECSAALGKNIPSCSMNDNE